MMFEFCQQTSPLMTLSEKIKTNLGDVTTQVSELKQEMDALRQKVISIEDLKATQLQHLSKARQKLPKSVCKSLYITIAFSFAVYMCKLSSSSMYDAWDFFLHRYLFGSCIKSCQTSSREMNGLSSLCCFLNKIMLSNFTTRFTSPHNQDVAGEVVAQITAEH